MTLWLKTLQRALMPQGAREHGSWQSLLMQAKCLGQSLSFKHSGDKDKMVMQALNMRVNAKVKEMTWEDMVMVLLKLSQRTSLPQVKILSCKRRCRYGRLQWIRRFNQRVCNTKNPCSELPLNWNKVSCKMSVCFQECVGEIWGHYGKFLKKFILKMWIWKALLFYRLVSLIKWATERTFLKKTLLPYIYCLNSQ